MLGKFNLKRNKDYKKNQNEPLIILPLQMIHPTSFVIETQFDPKKQIFGVVKVKEGMYAYSLKGINPEPVEHFKVTLNGDISTITVQLPDNTDADRYNN